MMNGHKGKIIALTSYGSRRYIPGYAAMGTNKAAIEAMVRYLAVDLAPKGVLVNAVNGGPVDTDSLRIIPGNEEIVRESVKRTPAGRIGRPEDLANVVAFLASDEADWIVGQTIIADGGVSLY
ncbi:MAG: SDR family oxidoreductase [candidate division Zixibacteria bacterium]|nr:SDR family oxidoreductase [candidate division Zixibacteria bacterium]